MKEENVQRRKFWARIFILIALVTAVAWAISWEAKEIAGNSWGIFVISIFSLFMAGTIWPEEAKESKFE